MSDMEIYHQWHLILATKEFVTHSRRSLPFREQSGPAFRTSFIDGYSRVSSEDEPATVFKTRPLYRDVFPSPSFRGYAVGTGQTG